MWLLQGSYRLDDDDYFQSGAHFRLMTPEQQQILFEDTTRSLGYAHGTVADVGPRWRSRALFNLRQ